MHGKSNMETYITMCKIDGQWEFVVWLRKLKQRFCINLEEWDGEGDERKGKKKKKKKTTELPYGPAIPLLGIYPGKNCISKYTCISMFTAALFIIAKTWKEPINNCALIDEWIKKMFYIYIYVMKYYSAIKTMQ